MSSMIFCRQLTMLSSSLFRRSFSSQTSLIDVHHYVQEALSTKKPIVALESTIITHGMPYPQNIETALEVEDIVRRNGSTPATIAILNGRIKVGLDPDDLKALASMSPDKVIKCSRRDLPFLIGNSLSGGTTVAGTMIIANMVGIKVFATGGIGGVHREGQHTMDVSADLIELGRTPVCVVSSGVKSILDIPRTLEYLETQGVCVSSYGSPEKYFPDFYTPNSGYKVPYNVDTPEQAAALIRALSDLDLKSGILIGVPVPKEHAIDKKFVDNAIQTALQQAKERSIEGKAVTPFILAAVSKLTKGKSLAANMALIKNNVKVAAQISKAFYIPTQRQIKNERHLIPPVVIGGSILDLSMKLHHDFQLDGATYEVNARQSAGGVGRNIAEGIYKLYGGANFISAIGTDELGSILLNLTPKPLTERIHRDPKQSTSLCSVIIDKKGDCKLVLGNMEVHQAINSNLIKQHEDALRNAPLIVMDANLPLESMTTLLTIARDHQRPVFFEPTDMRIASKPFSLPESLRRQIRYISPNIYELIEISKALSGHHSQVPDERDALLPFAKELLESVHEHFHCILLTLGEHGVIVDRAQSDLFLGHSDGAKKRSIRFYPTETISKIVNVSGAGDSFSSGFISNMLKGKPEEECVALGFFAAKQAILSNGAVPHNYFENGSAIKAVKWENI